MVFDETFQDFLHIMNFIGKQMVQGPNESFSAASKGFPLNPTFLSISANIWICKDFQQDPQAMENLLFSKLVKTQ